MTPPKGGKRQGGTPSGGKRWTPEEEELLLNTVEGAAVKQDAIRKVAKKLGRVEGTVMVKYYDLRRKRQAQAARNGQGPVTALDVSAIPTDDLIPLMDELEAELRRRMERMRKAVGD